MNKKIASVIEFMVMFFGLVGIIGGFGYSVYYGEYAIAGCLVLLGIVAFPVYKTYFINNFK